MDTIADDSIEAVLQVLLLMVFADRKAEEEELVAVREAVADLSIFTDNAIAVPAEGLGNLMIRQAARVRALIDDSNLGGATDIALRRIAKPELRPLVLAAMREIASSDTNIHVAETGLLEKAEAFWS